MSILSVVKDVCLAVGVNQPVSMFATSIQPRTQAELLSLANEMAQRIAYDTRDWTELKLFWQFAQGAWEFVGASTPLPSNYKRMLLTTNVWRSDNRKQPMAFIADTDEWYRRRLAGEENSSGEWTLIGKNILTAPVYDDTFHLVYLDRNCVQLSGGGFGDVFMNDADSFRLDERLLKLGMIYQWKMNKGSPYAEDMGSFSDALANAMGRDQPAPIIAGRSPISQSATVAYPWPLP
jgi:hypothetical protein